MDWLDTITVGISQGRDPHVATTGRVFSAVYGGITKNISQFDERVGKLFFDCVIVAASPRDMQIMYKGKYAAGGEVSPPICYSDNGIGPSEGAPQPQKPLCAQCDWRRFGTDVNDAGKPVPRCTKKKRIVVVPLALGYDTPLQFDLPPACHQNLAGFKRQVLDSKQPGLNIVVRVWMVENENGFLNFEPVGYVNQMCGPEALAHMNALSEREDVAAMARRYDRPIDPASWRPELAGVVDAIVALPSPQMIQAQTGYAPAVTYAPPAAPALPIYQQAYSAPSTAVTYAPPAAPAPQPPAQTFKPQATTFQPYVAVTTPQPVQGEVIEPDAPATGKKGRGRPKKDAALAPAAADAMAAHGMVTAAPVGKDLAEGVMNALNVTVPPKP
jgi:hypothetical protein